MLRESDPQTTIWELVLAEEAKRLPAELAKIDAFLDDERFVAPWRGCLTGGWAARRCRSTPCCGCWTSSTATSSATRAWARKSATRSAGGGAAASAWTGRSRTRPRWSNWSAGLGRR